MICRHLTALDMGVAHGTLAKPQHWDPLLEILRERGRRHEAAFFEHLQGQGFKAVAIPGVDITEDAVASARQAMAKGEQILIQAALEHGRWSGRADILRRIEKPSALGAWSYEIIDVELHSILTQGGVTQH